MTPRAGLAALAVVALWGFNFVVLKVGVGAMPPLFFTALRFGLMALLLAPVLVRRRLRVLDVLPLAVTLGVLHFGLLATGVRGIDAATAAIAAQLMVPFSALLAAVFFGDRLGWRRGAGMAVAFAGVALLADEPLTWQKALGGALTVSGVAVIQFRSLRKAARHKSPRPT